jgi:hypothetical protein
MNTLEDVIQRVLSEYVQMPGLRLTAAQMQRLCGLDGAMCQRVLHALVGAKFLCLNPDGHYMRLTTGHHPRPASVQRRAEQLIKAS